MAKKYIDAELFWKRLTSMCEGTWTDLDTVYDLLSRMPNIDYEIINDAHNEGYDVGYWAGRRDYEPRWIPVTERLPEEEGQYLVSCDTDYGVEVARFYIDEDGERYFGCDWNNPEDIEAWMPLPEPYKGGEEE